MTKHGRFIVDARDLGWPTADPDTKSAKQKAGPRGEQTADHGRFIVDARDLGWPTDGTDTKSAKWTAELHPRDQHGRFIKVGGHVQLSNGERAKVTAVSGGKVHVTTAGGKSRVVSAHSLQVVHGGKAPAAGEPKKPTAKAPSAAKKPTVTIKPSTRAPRSAAPAPKANAPAKAPGRGHGPKAKPTAPAPAAPAPKTEPKIKALAASDSQRKAMATHFDLPGQPPELRAAAAAIGKNEPITAKQSDLLVAAARKLADDPNTPKAKSKSLNRAIERIGSVSAHLHGIKPEHTPAHKGAQKTKIADLAEGDTVALPGPGGSADIRKVVSARPWYSVHEVTLEDANGNREVRFLTGTTDAYVLPDTPDPKPVPPKTKGPVREHITPDRLQPGDVFQYGDNNDSEYRVVSVEPGGSPYTTKVTYQSRKFNPDTGEYSGDWQPHTDQTTVGHPSYLPSVIRRSRGPASEGQPYDAAIPDDKPTKVKASDLKVGDRVSLEDFGVNAVGTITGITELNVGGGIPKREINYRTAMGSSYGDKFPHDQEFTRLSDGGDGAAERIAQVQAEADMRTAASQLADHLHKIDSSVRRAVADAARKEMTVRQKMSPHMNADQLAEMAAKSIEFWSGKAGEPYKPTNNQASLINNRAEQAAHYMSSGGSKEETTAIRDRLAAVFQDAAAQARDRAAKDMVETIRNAAPTSPGESYADAAYNALPTDDHSTASAAAGNYKKAAAALAKVMPELGTGTTAKGLPDVPTLPEGTDLKSRMAAYKKALGGEFGTAKTEVTVFKPITIAELEAGKTPQTEKLVMGTPDRAADFGPGEATMRHLAIVRAAGRDLDAELQRRLDAGSKQLQQEELDRKKQGEAGKLRISELTSKHSASVKTLRDKYAVKNGFDSWGALEKAFGSATSGYELERTKQLMKAGREFADTNSASLEAKLDAAYKEQLALIKADAFKKWKVGDLRRKHTLALLDEVRGMGGKGFAYVGPKSGKPKSESDELVKAMRYAEAGYPTDWLKTATSKLGTIKLERVQRGGHQYAARHIGLSESGRGTTSAGTLGQTADHELGHEMEFKIPGLLAAEEALLWSRTSTGKIGSRQRELKSTIFKGEKGYKDEFPEHYTGKDYIVGGKLYAAEVFTTAKESLTSGAEYLDADLRQWLLGTLALL